MADSPASPLRLSAVTKGHDSAAPIIWRPLSLADLGAILLRLRADGDENQDTRLYGSSLPHRRTLALEGSYCHRRESSRMNLPCGSVQMPTPAEPCTPARLPSQPKPLHRARGFWMQATRILCPEQKQSTLTHVASVVTPLCCNTEEESPTDPGTPWKSCCFPSQPEPQMTGQDPSLALGNAPPSITQGWELGVV